MPPANKRRQRGFTLLEVLVATTIMAISIVGLVSLLSGSLRNAARLTDYDRASILARRKMDELLLDRRVPRFVVVQGVWPEQATGSIPVGWRAMVRPFDVPPGFGPGTPILDRIELTVYWHDSSEHERTFTLEAFRRGILSPPDAAMAKSMGMGL